MEYKQNLSSESNQLCRQYTVDRLKQSYIPCVNREVKPVAHPYTDHIREYPPTPHPPGWAMSYAGVANSQVTYFDYGQYVELACAPY